ncbi:hypothetical protein ARMSODRAFT_1020270 [Armillaria solidipes]|uniref:Uncharacterized protein n=1 Tax=Armillaria solidipes TaxID=1076256 RepID=A0A2H3BV23_9AGAR|nr:hypothetical protein ARMSODRAFT_1020270 [Armillaria solidipes]
MSYVFAASSETQSDFRFHAGQDQHGRTFGQAFPNFRDTYLQPFTRFLKKAYPAEVRAARALKDFSPAEKALAETERTDASVDVDKDVGSDERATANGADKDVIPEGRAEPLNLGVGGSPDDVDGILRADAGRQEDIVEPPAAGLEPEQHEQDHDDRQPAPNPSVRSSPAIRLSPPIPKEPTQESVDNSNDNSQSPATKATSSSGNADSPDNDKSTEGEQMTAVMVKKVKPRPKPIKRPAANSTLAGTREKRTRTGPAPKEILTLAERAKHQGGSVPPSSAARKGRKSA